MGLLATHQLASQFWTSSGFIGVAAWIPDTLRSFHSLTRSRMTDRSAVANLDLQCRTIAFQRHVEGEPRWHLQPVILDLVSEWNERRVSGIHAATPMKP